MCETTGAAGGSIGLTSADLKNKTKTKNLEEGNGKPFGAFANKTTRLQVRFITSFTQGKIFFFYLASRDGIYSLIFKRHQIEQGL